MPFVPLFDVEKLKRSKGRSVYDKAWDDMFRDTAVQARLSAEYCSVAIAARNTPGLRACLQCRRVQHCTWAARSCDACRRIGHVYPMRPRDELLWIANPANCRHPVDMWRAAEAVDALDKALVTGGTDNGD